MQSTRRPQAFTLIELLVVVSIIAILIGILLPALGKARESGRQVQCLANSRQWGLGNANYLADFKGIYPWEGLDITGGSETTPGSGINTTYNSGDMQRTFNISAGWVSSVTPYIAGGQTYRSMYLSTGKVALPGVNSPFCCPSAQAPEGIAAAGGYGGSSAITILDNSGNIVSKTMRYFFSYGVNSKFNSAGAATGADTSLFVTANFPAATGYGKQNGESLVRADKVPQPSYTALMTELRNHPDELTPAEKSAGYYNTKALNRISGDWQRFANRHNSGGNITMCDGSAKFFKYDYVTRTVSGLAGAPTTSPTDSFNKTDLIWVPANLDSGN